MQQLNPVPEKKLKRKSATPAPSTDTAVPEFVSVCTTPLPKTLTNTASSDIPKDLSVGCSSVPADANEPEVKPYQGRASRACAVSSGVAEDLRFDSVAIVPEPTFAGREVSVVKVVLANDRIDNDSDVEQEDVTVDRKQMEVVPDYAVLHVLQDQVADLQNENEALKRDNNKLRSLNMKLQEALLEKPAGQTFSALPGYPDAKWLLSISQNAQESDYLFVKELVFHLFPQGLGNATVSGLPSNNPSGRGRNSELAAEDREPVEQIDPEKVKYIRGKFNF